MATHLCPAIVSAFRLQEVSDDVDDAQLLSSSTNEVIQNRSHLDPTST